MRERLGYTRIPLIRHANTVIRILADIDTAWAASPFPFNRKKDYFADMRNTRIDAFSLVSLGRCAPTVLSVSHVPYVRYRQFILV